MDLGHGCLHCNNMEIVSIADEAIKCKILPNMKLRNGGACTFVDTPGGAVIMEGCPHWREKGSIYHEN